MSYIPFARSSRRPSLPALLFMALCLFSCSSSNSSDASESASVLDSVTHALTSQDGLPGAAAIIVDRDSVLEMKAQGLRKNGTTDSIQIDDFFHIGSLTKSMTACMIARLVESGHLQWNSHPGEVLPGIADSLDPGFAQVTLLDLLRHRAGFPEDDDLTDIPQLTGTLSAQRLQLARQILARPPVVEPGEFRYSNTGYAVAAAMAEAVTGQNWRDLMDSLLFEPLGMTVVYGWPTDAKQDAPWGHDSTFAPVSPAVEDPSLDVIEPAGFVSTNLASIARYLHFRLQLATTGSPLLGKAAADTLQTPVGDYAAGMVVQNEDNQIIYFHDGSNGYFYALMAILPQDNLATALFVNAGGDAAAGAPLDDALSQMLSTYLNR